MKPAAERKAELADQLSKAARQGTAIAVAGAIIDAIDQSLAERGLLGTARQVTGRRWSAGRAMIRSLSTIYHRLVVGILVDRGLSLHKVAEGAAVSIVELRRLMEFALPLSQEEAARLVAWGTRMLVVSKPRKPATRVTRMASRPCRTSVLPAETVK